MINLHARILWGSGGQGPSHCGVTNLSDHCNVKSCEKVRKLFFLPCSRQGWKKFRNFLTIFVDIHVAHSGSLASGCALARACAAVQQGSGNQVHLSMAFGFCVSEYGISRNTCTFALAPIRCISTLIQNHFFIDPVDQ